MRVSLSVALVRLSLCDDADDLDARAADDVDEVDDVAVLELLIGLEVELLVGHGQEGLFERVLQGLDRHLVLVDIKEETLGVARVLLDRQDDVRVLGHVGGELRAGDPDIDTLLDEGRHDHEDDEKDEQDVTERDDIRLGPHGLLAAHRN